MDLGADTRLLSPQTRISLGGCSPPAEAPAGGCAGAPHRGATSLRLPGFYRNEGGGLSTRGVCAWPVLVTEEDREGSNPLGQ